jgi:hypothetical protein
MDMINVGISSPTSVKTGDLILSKDQPFPPTRFNASMNSIACYRHARFVGDNRVRQDFIGYLSGVNLVLAIDQDLICIWSSEYQDMSWFYLNSETSKRFNVVSCIL